MAYSAFDPREAYREGIGTLHAVKKDGTQAYCISITADSGATIYIPMYLSEEVKSEDLPSLPFLEMHIRPGDATYETQGVAASTRKMEVLCKIHVYFANMDYLDRTEFAKKIKNELHNLTRTNQSCSIDGIDFMNIQDDGLVEETDGRQIIFHYILTIYFLYYDFC